MSCEAARGGTTLRLNFLGATQLPSTRSSCLPPARPCNAVDSLYSILQIARRKRRRDLGVEMLRDTTIQVAVTARTGDSPPDRRHHSRRYRHFCGGADLGRLSMLGRFECVTDPIAIREPLSRGHAVSVIAYR
jgi:hypothetical protein